MCFINSILSTSSGRDRLDVFYQLDYLVGIDSMCFINSTSSGKDRLDRSARISLDSRLLGVSRAACNRGYQRLHNAEQRLRQDTDTLEATGTPTVAQMGTFQARLQEVTSAYLLCFKG